MSWFHDLVSAAMSAPASNSSLAVTSMDRVQIGAVADQQLERTLKPQPPGFDHGRGARSSRRIGLDRPAHIRQFARSECFNQRIRHADSTNGTTRTPALTFVS